MKTFVASLVLRFADRLSGPARAAARTIGSVERAQKLAAQASAQWGRGLDQLDEKLDRLSKVSLVTEGLDRAGRAMVRPLVAATRSAADFNRNMTGIGITAEMTDRDLIPLRRTILDTASELGVLPATVQAAFGAVLAEGVYRTEQELSRAGRAVSRFQALAATMNDPISGAEAGGLSAGLATSFNVAASRLDHANAMLNRAAKVGGVGMGVQSKFLPEQAASMKGLGSNSERGLADLLAANQVAKRGTGSSEQAANNVSNLLNKIASPEVLKNFKDAGVDLEAEIKRGVANNISAIETFVDQAARLTGGDKFRLGELVQDAQASSALTALVQNIDDFKSKSREMRGDRVLQDYYADLARAADGPAASFDRYTTATSRAGIATGSILAPAAGWAAGLLERVANWMARAEESANPLARVAVFAAAGLAGVAVAAGFVGNAVMGILGPWFIMKSLFGTMGGAAVKAAFAGIARGIGVARIAMMGLNLTMLANPLVLGIMAAVAGIALVALVVRKYWAPISAFARGVGQALGEAFGPPLRAIGGWLRPLKPLWDGISGAAAAFVGWLGRLITPVTRTDAELASATENGRRFGRAIVNALRMSPIGLFVRTLVGGYRVIRAVLSWRPGPTVERAWAGITGLFARLTGRFTNAGRDMMRGLIAGLRVGGGPVGAVVAGIGGLAVNAFRNRLGIQSPSRVFAGLGMDTMAGLTLGLDRGRPGVLGRLSRLATAMAGGLIIAAPGVAAAGVGVGGPLPPPGPYAPPTSPPPAGPGGGMVYNDYRTQTFTVTGEGKSVRQIARELVRLGRAEARGGLDDGGER